MEAGDLLIFNSLQPHGIRPNLSGNKVRIAQYISMMPAEEDNEPFGNGDCFMEGQDRAGRLCISWRSP